MFLFFWLIGYLVPRFLILYASNFAWIRSVTLLKNNSKLE
ncbi:hypothetical protein LEP1GSC047_0107 [Leptospira inadai serovar Lyme str. 10]|uniref:Uncharacterized protein n=1 Tax=Leptospira inadai serovar Lyme str. 10 TaxID=1049790 RepID=V6HFV1_9LEPT|nr:hypothetical protein LEP1GSC047_0107 [Leptospira inadai serovar Lyme str. 10]